MKTQTDDHMIKLARDAIHLVILRWRVDEAMSSKPIDRQKYDRLTHACDLLADCKTTKVLQ